MRDWVQDIAVLVLLWLGIQGLWRAVLTGPTARQRRLGRALTRLARRVRRTPEALPQPTNSPIEDVCDDVRRLRLTFHRGGMRFAKYEGCRMAYDSALGEAATGLGLDHLMAALPPGTELDHERQRVEEWLEEAGVLPPLWWAA